MNNTQKQHAVRCEAYYRTAVRDQHSQEKIEEQRNACREFVAKRGWTLIGEFEDEGVAGRGLKRPGLTRLLGLLKDDKAALTIVVHRLDRISRSLKDVTDLRARGIEIASVIERDDDTPAAHLPEMFSRLIAEYASDLHSEATRRGIHRARAHKEQAGKNAEEVA